MNVNLVRLKGVERELARLNRNIERYLSYAFGLSPEPTKAVAEGSPPEVAYTDEIEDAVREYRELRGKVASMDEE